MLDEAEKEQRSFDEIKEQRRCDERRFDEAEKEKGMWGERKEKV